MTPVQPKQDINFNPAAMATSGANYAQVRFGNVNIPGMSGYSVPGWVVAVAILGGILWYKLKK